MENIKKASSEWIKEVGYEIIDPDGWDRTNYDYSFNVERLPRKNLISDFAPQPLYEN